MSKLRNFGGGLNTPTPPPLGTPLRNMKYRIIWSPKCKLCLTTKSIPTLLAPTGQKQDQKPARRRLYFVDRMWLRAFLLDHWTYDTEGVRGHSLSSHSIGVAVIYVRRLSSGLIPCFNINQYNCLLKPDAASFVFSASKLTTESTRRGLIVSRREVNFYGILLPVPVAARSKA